MLDYITVKGFRSIKSIEKLELGPLTVLIGANGSGKSNFVGVFSFLNALREGRLKEYVLRAGGAEKVLHYGSRVTEHLEIHISIGGGQAKYWIKLVPTGADELVLLSEFIDAENFGRGPIRSYWKRSWDPPRGPSERAHACSRRGLIRRAPNLPLPRHRRPLPHEEDSGCPR